MSLEQRIAALVAAVGGPTKAAALIGRTRTHIDNMRKPGAVLRLEDLLPLCIEAGMSLDWVATGYQQRPDLAGAGGGDTTFIALRPLRQGEKPPEFLVNAAWLGSLGLDAEAAAYGRSDDDGMKPVAGRGAVVIVDVRAATKPRSGIYTVEIGDELLVRRLHRLPSGGAELVADADPSWRYPVAEHELAGLRRVVWSGQAV